MAGYPKAMMFVDGSNFLIEIFDRLGVGISLRADKPSATAFNVAFHTLVPRMSTCTPGGPHSLIRSYWFGSIQGSDEDILRAETDARAVGFDARLFRKIKGRDEKGVDLAIAREMLIHAFNRNYEAAILVAGDEDYLGLVDDLKRLGVTVTGLFLEGKALSPRLKLAFDNFLPLDLPGSTQPALLQALKDEARTVSAKTPTSRGRR